MGIAARSRMRCGGRIEDHAGVGAGGDSGEV